MKAHRIALAFAALFTLQALAPSQAAAAQIGKVVAVQGTPNADGPSGNRNLAAGSVVFEDDKVTVTSGNAQIMLDDGTKLVVGPGSALVLGQYLKRSGTTASRVSVKALRGTFRFITGRSPKSAYRITTANATIGIRGTGFDFWVKKQTGVAVLVGTVSLSGGGTTTVIAPNCDVGVTGGGKPASNAGPVPAAFFIRANLPYILNQAPLNRQFRLPVQKCSSKLSLLEGGGDGGPRNNDGGGQGRSQQGIKN